MTQPGIILGTAPYMSPEQAKGKAVDKRTDIWAFGCILYECLTGRMAFSGDSVSEVLASILKEDPDWNFLPAALPVSVRQVLSRSLQKKPDLRPRDIRDLRLAIVESGSFELERGPFHDTDTQKSRSQPKSIFGIAAALVLLAALAGIIIDRFLLNPSSEKPASSPVRFSVDLPKEQHVRLFRDNPFIAISPDGKRIAWIGETGRVFIRELNSFEIHEVKGTENLDPRSPVVFSLDGLRIGFIRDFTVFEVPIEGGAPNRIFGDKSMTGLYSFVWGDDGSLVLHFANSSIKRVLPGADEIEDLTTLDETKNEFTHLWPTVLPGSKAVIFAVSVGCYDNTHIEVLSLETGERHEVIPDSFSALYSPTGHLLHVRDGTLYAIPFDLDELQVNGPETPVLSGIQMNTQVHWIPGLCISRNGTLVYIPADQGFGEHQMVWLDRNNKIVRLPGVEEGVLGRPVLSPNGKYLAYQRLLGHSFQIFLYELERDNTRQLTFEGTNHSPVWSPDSKRLVFARGHEEQVNIFEMPVAVSQSPKRVRKHRLIEIPSSWTENGNLLAYINRDEKDQRDIWIFPLNGTTTEPVHLLKSEWSEGNGVFSFDGRWLAYVSEEQGQPEVFIRELPRPDMTAGKTKKVSRSGGIDPIWSDDGKELYYLSLDATQLFKVSIETDPLRIGPEQEVLVQTNFPKWDWITFYGVYDVVQDGDRFVAVLEKERPETMRINVVLNWFEELRRLVPTKK
jgi:serine/threonine-protein kinase